MMDMELYSAKTMEIAGQKIKTNDKIGFADFARIVMTLSEVMITEDPETGAPIVDKLNYRPVALFYILKSLTDMDMTKYSGENGDLYLLVDDVDFADADTRVLVYAMYGAVERMYEPIVEQKVREIHDRNSVAAQLRQLTRQLVGSKDGKDVGVIRLLLTELFMKMQRKEQGQRNDEGIASGKIVDLSEFKPKKM